MLTILKTNGTGMGPSDDIRQGQWINLVDPSQEELEAVEGLGILPEFLRYPLDQEESSRVEMEEDQVLIIIKVPERQDDGEFVRFETIPLGIIFAANRVITVSFKEIPVVDGLSNGKGSAALLTDPARFIFTLFLQVSSLYLRHLRTIDRLIDEYEAELHRSMRNQELIKLLNLEKSLVYFNTSLKANDLVMARLQSGRYIPISEESEDVLEDALIENQQAIEMARIYSDILSGTMDAYASVISNNLNIVMKFLTAVTIVLTLPTLVASIYGMNIKLPLQDNPHAFAITMGIAFGLSIITVYIFAKKQMF